MEGHKSHLGPHFTRNGAMHPVACLPYIYYNFTFRLSFLQLTLWKTNQVPTPSNEK